MAAGEIQGACAWPWACPPPRCSTPGFTPTSASHHAATPIWGRTPPHCHPPAANLPLPPRHDHPVIAATLPPRHCHLGHQHEPILVSVCTTWIFEGVGALLGGWLPLTRRACVALAAALGPPIKSWSWAFCAHASAAATRVWAVLGESLGVLPTGGAATVGEGMSDEESQQPQAPLMSGVSSSSADDSEPSRATPSSAPVSPAVPDAKRETAGASAVEHTARHRHAAVHLQSVFRGRAVRTKLAVDLSPAKKKVGLLARMMVFEATMQSSVIRTSRTRIRLF